MCPARIAAWAVWEVPVDGGRLGAVGVDHAHLPLQFRYSVPPSLGLGVLALYYKLGLWALVSARIRSNQRSSRPLPVVDQPTKCFHHGLPEHPRLRNVANASVFNGQCQLPSRWQGYIDPEVH